MRLAEGLMQRTRGLVVRRTLAAGLYPTPRAHVRRPRWRRLATPTAAIVVGTVAQLVRLTGTQALNTVWAEDGTIFLRDAYNRPSLRAVLHTYAGYLHIVPRLLAEVASVVHVKDASAVMSGGAAVVVAMLAVVVFRASGDVISAMPVRVLLAAAMIVLPATGFEIMDAAANLHWYLIFAAFWVLLWRPASRGERVVAITVLAAATLSDPLTISLAPVAVARWFALPSRGDRVVTLGYFVGIVIQFGFALLATSNPIHIAPDALSVAKVYGLRVAAASILGDQFTNRLFATMGWALAIVGAAVVVGILVFGLRRWNPRRAVVALAVLSSSAVFLIPIVLRWEPSLVTMPGQPALGGGSRYMVPPLLLLISAFLVIADQAGQRWQNASVASFVALALAFTWGPGFLVHNERSLGPRWRAQLVEARKQCASSSGTARVDIPPQIPKGVWSVPVPCKRLR